MPTVSILVPVYKAEKTLDACVESILAQTFTDLSCCSSTTAAPTTRARSVTNWQPLTRASGRCIVQTAARVRPAAPGWTPLPATGCCF